MPRFRLRPRHPWPRALLAPRPKHAQDVAFDKSMAQARLWANLRPFDARRRRQAMALIERYKCSLVSSACGDENTGRVEILGLVAFVRTGEDIRLEVRSWKTGAWLPCDDLPEMVANYVLKPGKPDGVDGMVGYMLTQARLNVTYMPNTKVLDSYTDTVFERSQETVEYEERQRQALRLRYTAPGTCLSPGKTLPGERHLTAALWRHIFGREMAGLVLRSWHRGIKLRDLMEAWTHRDRLREHFRQFPHLMRLCAYLPPEQWGQPAWGDPATWMQGTPRQHGNDQGPWFVSISSSQDSDHHLDKGDIHSFLQAPALCLQSAQEMVRLPPTMLQKILASYNLADRFLRIWHQAGLDWSRPVLAATAWSGLVSLHGEENGFLLRGETVHPPLDDVHIVELLQLFYQHRPNIRGLDSDARVQAHHHHQDCWTAAIRQVARNRHALSRRPGSVTELMPDHPWGRAYLAQALEQVMPQDSIAPAPVRRSRL